MRRRLDCRCCTCLEDIEKSRVHPLPILSRRTCDAVDFRLRERDEIEAQPDTLLEAERLEEVEGGSEPDFHDSTDELDDRPFDEPLDLALEHESFELDTRNRAPFGP